MENSEEYKIIFFEIINGYSTSFHSFYNQVFIKHLSYIDLAQFDVEYNIYLEQAKKDGILTYKEKEKQIIKDGLWLEKDQIDFELNTKLLQDLKINHSKDYLLSRRQGIKKDIELSQVRLNTLKLKKSFYIGQIAEDFANRSLNYKRIVNSFFKNKECTDLLINDDNIDDEKYEELQRLYYNNQEKLNTDNIRKISLSPFFVNIYCLCQDDAYSFYGKPLIKLSSYQCDLILFGRHFKNILSQRQDIPSEIINNPDELMEWLQIRENAEKQGIINNENDESSGATSIMGATKKDLEVLGLKANNLFNLTDELKKHGGKLDSNTLYKLHNK